MQLQDCRLRSSKQIKDDLDNAVRCCQSGLQFIEDSTKWTLLSMYVHALIRSAHNVQFHMGLPSSPQIPYTFRDTLSLLYGKPRYSHARTLDIERAR